MCSWSTDSTPKSGLRYLESFFCIKSIFIHHKYNMSCRELLADFNFMVVRVEYQTCTILLFLQLVAVATINSALQLLIKGGFFLFQTNTSTDI